MDTDNAASVPAKLEAAAGSCELTYDSLDTQTIIDSVRAPEAGALAIFIGTTRNSFKGAYSLASQLTQATTGVP